MKKNVFGLRGVAIFAALVLLLAGFSVPAFADYWVTYSGTGARGPIRSGQDVDWSTGDTKIVSDEVIGWYNDNSGVFTVTEVTATGAELNEIDGLGLGTVTTGITAHADGLQAGATALSTGFNNVMTVAGAGDSVLLPAAAAGNVVWVKNSGANSIAVFPSTSDSIDALAVNLAVTVDPGSVARFVAKDAIVWESNVDDSITLNAPTTAKGGFRIKATDNTADYTFTLTNAAHGQSSTVTIPDSGLATSYVLQSTAAITAAEANVLDGATAGTQVASKAVVADANVNIGVVKATELHIGATGVETQVTATGAEINQSSDLSAQVLTPGAGITAGVGTIYKTSIIKQGDIIKTTILMDLTGLASTTTDTDIIGTAGVSHLGQITAAKNGTIFYGQVTCLETPATGADDVVFYSATENSGAYDGLITDLAETVLYDKTAAAAAAAATQIALTALPAANEYLYLANGEAGTVGTYTAGQFMIELWGY